jgi:hypothetical protein
MINRIILLLVSILCLNGCTKDDICSGETPTTPLLIIVFKDIDNPLEAKNVPNLSVIADYANDVEVFSGSAIDSIAIPLRTGADSTRFRFSNENDLGTFNNIDIVSFNYQRQDIYVNRACGYKTIYSNLESVLDLDANNWILNFEIENQIIEDETKAHITIFH